MFASFDSSRDNVSCDVYPVTDMAQLIFKIMWRGDNWRALKALDKVVSSNLVERDFTRKISDEGAVTWRQRTRGMKRRIFYMGYQINVHIYPINSHAHIREAHEKFQAAH